MKSPINKYYFPSFFDILKSKLFLLLILTLFSSGIKVTAQGNIPTVGKEFWFGFMDNISGGDLELRLFITGTKATSGTVSAPLMGWSQNFTTAPGTTTVVLIPSSIALNQGDGVVDTKGVHVVANDSISLFSINFKPYSADGASILPVNSLGTEYYVPAYKGLDFSFNSEFLIVATADNTEIDITPSANTNSGHAPGVKFTISLDEGESYQLKGYDKEDLTGTLVKATAKSGDCRPFAVFGGSLCANIPTGCAYCDHVFDQALPYKIWGKEYLVVPFLKTTGYTYRVMAQSNNTAIYANGALLSTLNAGNYYEINNCTSALKLTSTKPFATIQYMQGIDCSGYGDPSMLTLNSIDQKIDKITFATVVSSVITEHMVNIIVKTADINAVTLDGAFIATSKFTPFPTDPSNSYAQITITEGSHTLKANNGINAYVYGAGAAESYAYSVGSLQNIPKPLIDTAYCSSNNVTLAAPISLFDPYWTLKGTPNDTIGKQPSLVLTPPYKNDVYVISGNSLVSGCEKKYYFSVESPTPPVIKVSADRIKVCKFNKVQMKVDILPKSGNYKINWSPAYFFDDPHSESPVLTAQNSGWYVSEVSTLTGCGTAKDSVYITVDGGGIYDVKATTDKAKICAPDQAQLKATVKNILFMDDFDGGYDPGLWNTISGYQLADSCGSQTGKALFFNQGTARVAETKALNLATGGLLSFYIKVASGTFPCEDADVGEDIVVEYSIDNGLNYSPIKTLFQSDYPNLTKVEIDLPAGANTSKTKIRWRQTAFTAKYHDAWVLEDVIVCNFDNTGLQFDWSPSNTLSKSTIPNPIAKPQQATWYKVNITSGSCSYSDSVLVDAQTSFQLTTTKDTALCSIQGLELSAIPSLPGNYTYQWTPNTSLNSGALSKVLANPSTTTQYTVVVSSDHGCTNQAKVTVKVADIIDYTLTGDSTTCSGLTTPFNCMATSSSSNYTINWYDGNDKKLQTGQNFSIAVVKNSLFYITITDNASNCSVKKTFNVTVPNFKVDAGKDTMMCKVQGMQLKGKITNASTYTSQWDHPEALSNIYQLNPTITKEASNDYILTVKSAGCTLSDTISVKTSKFPNIDLGPDVNICDYDSFALKNSTNYKDYLWEDLSKSKSRVIKTAGTFKLQVTDSLGCVSSDIIQITVLPSPKPQISSSIARMCLGDSTLLSLNSSFDKYEWSNGSTKGSTYFPYNGKGEAWIKVYNNYNCYGKDTIKIENIPALHLDLGRDKDLCDRNTVEIGANVVNASSYLWDNGSTTPFIDAGLGTHTLTVFADICKYKDTIKVNLGTPPSIYLGNDSLICLDDPLVLKQTKNNYIDSIVWNAPWNIKVNSFEYENHEPLELFSTFTISATGYGCGVRSDTINLSIEDCSCNLFVPNAFTPNGDERNDVMSISHPCDLESFEILIFDRWGSVIYQSNDPDFHWNGTYQNGRGVQMDVYIWKISYSYAKGNNKMHKTDLGKISVIR